MQRGAGSNDTWVVSGGPVSTFSLLPRTSHPTVLSRGGGDLPSRVADNLFWLGRYSERADAIARLARTVSARLAEQPDVGPRARGRARPAAGGAAPADPRRGGGRGRADRSAVRALDRTRAAGRGLRDRPPGNAALGDRGHPPGRPRRARSHLDRHLAHPDLAAAGAGGDGRRALERRQHAGHAGDWARSRDHAAGGAGRRGHGEHDPRPGVAVPRHGPPGRARAESGLDPARRADAHRRSARRRCWSRCSTSPTAA